MFSKVTCKTLSDYAFIYLFFSLLLSLLWLQCMCYWETTDRICSNNNNLIIRWYQLYSCLKSGLKLLSGHLDSAKCRSSHRRCSVKKGFLKNFIKFTEKHLCQSLFFNKVAGLGHFAKFLRTPFLQNTSERLLPERKFVRVLQKLHFNWRFFAAKFVQCNKTFDWYI